MFREFREFALKGSMTDMAVGIVIGAAFTAVANSIVSDLLTPLLGLFGDFNDLSHYFIVLTEGSPAGPYASLEAARLAGAATFNYGAFLATLLNFLVVALAIFLIVRTINRLRRAVRDEPAAESAAPASAACRFCKSSIHPEATRCPACTSSLQETD